MIPRSAIIAAVTQIQPLAGGTSICHGCGHKIKKTFFGNTHTYITEKKKPPKKKHWPLFSNNNFHWNFENPAHFLPVMSFSFDMILFNNCVCYLVLLIYTTHLLIYTHTHTYIWVIFFTVIRFFIRVLYHLSILSDIQVIFRFAPLKIMWQR